MAFGRAVGCMVVAAIAFIGLVIIAIPGMAVAAVFWVIDRFDTEPASPHVAVPVLAGGELAPPRA